jgi:hypothetical protein
MDKMGEKSDVYRISIGKPLERVHLKGHEEDGRIIVIFSLREVKCEDESCMKLVQDFVRLRNLILRQKLTVAQLVKTSLAPVQPESPLPYLQMPVIAPYLSQFKPLHLMIHYFHKLSPNIVLSYTSRSLTCFLHFKFLNKHFVRVSNISHARYMPPHLSALTI